jgi:hypothetical protein
MELNPTANKLSSSSELSSRMNGWKIAGPSHGTLVPSYSSSTVTLILGRVVEKMVRHIR